MPTAAPLFSIIVPTFNVAETLSACLSSVAGQTFDDFDVVLIDGGSSDGTLEIANSYSPILGERLAIHSGRDQGPYDAMNKGVGLARGVWLIFLGADDALHEADTLAKVAAFISEHEPSDLVYGDVMLRSDSTRYAGEFDLDRLLFDINICHQSIFYRRELFASIGPYNLRYKLWADWDFNVRCFSNPALVTRYMDIVVADYNDMSGLSSKQDDEFKKRLPRFIVASGVEMIRRRLPARKS
jgi:glycosyltransferase involved in cell wall biosynthesis